MIRTINNTYFCKVIKLSDKYMGRRTINILHDRFKDIIYLENNYGALTLLKTHFESF